MKKSILLLLVLTIFIILWMPISCLFLDLRGAALQLELPDDFEKPISFASGRKGEKDLFYWSIDGQMKVKTYTDWGILESDIVFVNK